MTTSTTTAESDSYLAAVREQLDDLLEEERTDLLEDLAQHLADTSANRAPDGPPLTTLLGSPAQYAAELRSAADLPARSGKTVPHESIVMRLGRALPVRAGQSIWRQPMVVQVREFVPQLRPAWWVLRGYLLIAIPALWDPDSSDDFPIPTVGGSHVAGLFFAALAIAASVALGRRSLGKGRWLVIAANTFLVFSGLSLLSNLEYRMSTGPSYVGFPSPNDEYPLTSRHGPVTNIFPYSANGTPLDQVLLYDQDGRPLKTAMQLWWADNCERVIAHPQAEDGVAVEFAYPKNYVLNESFTGEACEAQVSKPSVPLPIFGEEPDSSKETLAPREQSTLQFGPASSPPPISRAKTPSPALFDGRTGGEALPVPEEGRLVPPPQLDR